MYHHGSLFIIPRAESAGPWLTLVDAGDLARLGSLRLTLSVKGEVRQDSTAADMIVRPAQALTLLSRFQPMAPGDLLLTGTPVIQKKVVTPNDFASLGQISATLLGFVDRYNQTARPFSWNSPPATCSTSWTASAATSSKTTFRTNRYRRPHDNPRRTSGATHLSVPGEPFSDE